MNTITGRTPTEDIAVAAQLLRDAAAEMLKDGLMADSSKTITDLAETVRVAGARVEELRGLRRELERAKARVTEQRLRMRGQS